MGLKEIAFSGHKTGKSVYAISHAEIGPMGMIDTEMRHQWYTIPHPTVKPKAFPYENPRKIRDDLPCLVQSNHPIYLIETLEHGTAGEAAEKWNEDRSVTCIGVDSGSILWDLLADTVDDPTGKLGRLAWTPVKRVDARFRYNLMYAGAHVLITAHLQTILNKAGSVTDIRPWIEKKSPHWADLCLQFLFDPKAEHPSARVDGEGIGGGVNGTALRLGTVIENPTFKKILALAGSVPSVHPGLAPSEVAHRNKVMVADVASQAPVKGIDDRV